MKLPGEEESGRSGFPMIYMVLGVGVFVLIILLLVLKVNEKSNSGSEYLKQKKAQEEQIKQEQEVVQARQEETEPERKLRAQDLDFWDMYPADDADKAKEEKNTGLEQGGAKQEQSSYEKKAEEERKEQQQKEEEDNPATDGKHTLVTHADGTEEWVLISPYLTKNTYDFTKIEEKANIKRYMQNGKNISYVGVDISKHNGDINFASMKAAGVEYVMIRLGSRGYSTGQIALDEKFNDYIKGAVDAGLDVGVYFYSQAISQEEAVQEVNFVVQNLAPYQANVKYPVAFDMEYVVNDKARIDGLNRDDKTAIAVAFLEGVKAAGYVPMLYGDKEWLTTQVDLTKLQNFDVWLSQESDMPDYPYQFAMWQYSTNGVLNGITGNANLNLCFIAYSER